MPSRCAAVRRRKSLMWHTIWRYWFPSEAIISMAKCESEETSRRSTSLGMSSTCTGVMASAVSR